MEKAIDKLIRRNEKLIERNKQAVANGMSTISIGNLNLCNEIREEFIEDLDKLKSSLPKPVEVPEFVGEWYVALIKKGWSHGKIVRKSLHELEMGYVCYTSSVDEWLENEDNQELLIRMIYGYTVIKEPLYYMPVPYLDETYYVINESGMDVAYGIGDKFLGSELDKYFPDIKKLAVPVEEEAE